MRIVKNRDNLFKVMIFLLFPLISVICPLYPVELLRKEHPKGDSTGVISDI
jgi:hypothetical protein